MVGLRFLVPSIGVRVPVRQRCIENMKFTLLLLSLVQVYFILERLSHNGCK